MNAPLFLRVVLPSPLSEVPSDLRPILEAHPGETPVHLEAVAPGEWGPFILAFGQAYRVLVSPVLLAALVALLGCENVKPPKVETARPGDSVEISPEPRPAANVARSSDGPRDLGASSRTLAVVPSPGQGSEPPGVPGVSSEPHTASGRRFPLVAPEVERFALGLRGKPGMALQAIHEYTRADGAPWWWVARWKDSRTGEKMPLPFRPESGGFVAKMPNLPQGRPLYRLHKLGQYPSDPVYLVEGERCADCLEALGFLATTWPNGAQSVGKVDWSPLAGRAVVLWADNDRPGFEVMRGLQGTLERIGSEVYAIDVPALELSPKGDVVDWLRLFVERWGCRKLHEVPDGFSRAYKEIEALPIVEAIGEWKVAA